MERNGDVIAELNNCNSPNCALILNTFRCGNYKMCKDDFVTPIFHSASNHVGNGLVMDSRNLSPESYLNSNENSIGINFFCAKKNCVSSGHESLPIVENSTDNLKNNSISSSFEKPSPLQSFSSNSQKELEKLHINDTYVNGKNVQLVKNNAPVTEGCSIQRTQNSSGQIFSSANDIDNKLLLDYEAETSSSSLEELYNSVNKNSEQSEIKPVINLAIETDSNGSSSLNLEPQLENQTKFNDLSCNNNPNIIKDSVLDLKDNDDCPTKNERLMPELFPTLICLDDENSASFEKKQEKHEIIDVPDSPEMPILIPFTYEVDEPFHIKTEIVSDNDSRQLDSDSRDSTDEVRQPQILLKRLAFNHSTFPKEEKKSVLSSIKSESGKSVIEGPEIEEIEGVRFFQFHSKLEMDDFNSKNTRKVEMDLDMIVPTKTNDITQIKGWRDKYFAPESEFHQESFHFEVTKMDESSKDSKVSLDETEEGDNKNDSDENEKHNPSEASNLKSDNTSAIKQISGCTEVNASNNKCPVADGNDGKSEIRNVKIEESAIMSSKSAFISAELDKYLSNSSTLNVNFLQRVNPNIIPIPRNAPILSIGKLRKTEAHFSRANLFYKRKKEVLNIEKPSDTSESIITVTDSPESPSVITLSSEESSTEDDLPVASLRTKRAFKKEILTSKNVNKRNLNKEFDLASKRVVLRLRKESDGISKGYKVSNISCKNEKQESSSSASDISIDSIVMPEDGSLPVIKQTLFSKRNEPQLLDEFLNNLNMYGTRKDVAMLVQSNQSYFHEGPILNAKTCAKAISVLVSNKTFVNLKQKSKKKKLKTWQKYLPKKLSNMQKMKIKRGKRKTRVQSLLDDAENIISTEMGKRSIRLPARFLDSALLTAGSEWVSPVITIDDSPCKKRKHLQEMPDKPITIESDASETNSSSSSDSSSSENETNHFVDNSVSTQNDTAKSFESKMPDKKVEDSSSKVSLKRKSNFKHSQGAKRSFKKPVSENLANEKINDKSLNSANKENPIILKKYNLPNCACMHASRTAAFDIKIRNFVCYSCASIKLDVACNTSDSSSIADKNILENSKECISPSVKDDLCTKASLEPVSQEIENSITHDKELCNRSVSCDSSSVKALMSPNLPTEINQNDDNQISNSNTTLQSVNLSTTNSSNLLMNQDKKILAFDGNVNIPMSVPSNNMNKNYIFVLAPVKTFGNVNNATNTSRVPVLPTVGLEKKELLPSTVSKINQVSFPLNQTCTSPILIQKSSVPSDSVNYVLDYQVSSLNLQHHSAAFKLSKMAENHALTLSKSPVSISANISDNKEKTQSTISSSNSTNYLMNNPSQSGNSRKAVAAYKVGDNVILYNTLMQNTEVKAQSASNSTITSTTTKDNKTSGPIIASIKPNTSIINNRENVQFVQTLQNGLTKTVSLVNCDQKPSTSSDILKSHPVLSFVQNSIDKHHNYSKRKPNCRRKSPLIKMNCNEVEDEKSNLSSEDDIDIETVDTSWNAIKELKDAESDSDISDKECANIFSANADNLALMLCKKSVNEKKRRLLIKSGFENLKASSKEFKHAQSSIDILQMAIHVIQAAKRKERVLTLADKRMRLHNTMLLEKLLKLLEGVESPIARNKIKLQIIEDLAFDWKKHRKEKAQLLPTPSILKNCKEDLGNLHEYHSSNNAVRNKPSSDAADIVEIFEGETCSMEADNSISLKQQNQDVHKDSSNLKETKEFESSEDLNRAKELDHKYSKNLTIIAENSDDKIDVEEISVTEISENGNKMAEKAAALESQCHELRKLLSTPTSFTQSNITMSDALISRMRKNAQLRFAELKQKVSKSLQRKNVKEGKKSDSDTENLDSSGSSDTSDSTTSSDSNDIVEIFHSSESKKLVNKCSNSEDITENSRNVDSMSLNKTKKEYPGIIPIFHPKVMRENLKRKISPSDQNLISEGSSHEVETPMEIDEDITIIGAISGNSSNAKSIPLLKNNSITVPQADSDLAKAAKTANELFGPCRVQKVQLKSGCTVFAYKPEGTRNSSFRNPDSSITSNITGVRNMNDVFSAIERSKDSSNQNSRSVPEEIVILDSDDETEHQNTSNITNVSPCSSKEQNISKNSNASPLSSREQNIPQTSTVSSSSSSVVSSSTLVQLNSDESDSDYDRMLIDESQETAVSSL